MEEFLQKSKITLVSFTSLMIFGFLLNVLAWTLVNSNYFYSGLLLVIIFTEIAVTYLWLYKLHRVLLIIKYRKFKNGENKEDDGQGSD